MVHSYLLSSLSRDSHFIVHKYVIKGKTEQQFIKSVNGLKTSLSIYLKIKSLPLSQHGVSSMNLFIFKFLASLYFLSTN